VSSVGMIMGVFSLVWVTMRVTSRNPQSEDDEE
jgi:hypothetical protein